MLCKYIDLRATRVMLLRPGCCCSSVMLVAVSFVLLLVMTVSSRIEFNGDAAVVVDAIAVAAVAVVRRESSDD